MYLLAVERHEANERDKVRVGGLLLQPGVHLAGQLARQNLHQRLGRQLPHAVVLDRAAGQVCSIVKLSFDISSFGKPLPQSFGCLQSIVLLRKNISSVNLEL